MTKVLVLCHGNVCRSPASAAVLRFSGMDVRSAGLKPGADGHVAQKKIREAMRRLGYNLDIHRSREVEHHDTDWADIILVMDDPNHLRFSQRFPENGHKVRRLGRWADTPVDRIKDPGFMKRGPEVDAIVDLIVEASRNFVKEYTQ